MSKNIDLFEWVGILSNGFTDLGQEIAGAARDLYCSQAQNNPFGVLKNDPLTLDVSRKAIELFCGTPPPPQPQQNFTGGQCLTEYTLRCRCLASNVFGGADQVLEVNLATVDGAAAAILMESPGGSQILEVQYFRVGVAVPQVFPWNLSSSFRYIEGTFEVELIRKDGLPDDCGDPPPLWYPEEPPPADIDITNVDIDITNQAGETNTYNVTINRDENNYITFPPVINVNGTSVGIDATSINIGYYELNTPSGGGGEGDITIKPPNYPKTIVIEEQIPIPIENDSAEKDEEKLIGIYVNITNMPVNAKVVSGNGAPNLIYAGWVEFKRDTGYYPREYIDFSSSWFPAPEDATGYAVTLKQGYTGEVQEVKEAE